MIDPATGWIEIRSVPEARADLVANQVELAWLIKHSFTFRQRQRALSRTQNHDGNWLWNAVQSDQYKKTTNQCNRGKDTPNNCIYSTYL